MRIVSLLPSATEIICVLGLEEQLVGVTHECDYPVSVQALPKVTRTLIPTDASSAEIDHLVEERLTQQVALYTLDMETLVRLEPDLIVTQALCEVCAVAATEVEAAACTLPGRPRVLNLEPESLSEVFETIERVAEAAGVPGRGREVVEALQARVHSVVARAGTLTSRPRVALLEWIDPPFSAGHWSPELVDLAGGVDGLGRAGAKSRRLSWEEVTSWQPEVVLFACCGFDVRRTLQDVPILDEVPGWADLPAVRHHRVFVVDGSAYFSRPGPRLVESLELLAHAISPERQPLASGGGELVRVG
jgi:iron complex transport system substrate-binding protein